MKRTTSFQLRSIGATWALVPLGKQVSATNGLVILNEVARYLWYLLEADRSVEDLAVATAERFDVDLPRARLDVRAFIEQAAKLGLLA